jgi:hypothetical protein
MWKYFGGVTSYTVTDNLKSSVNRAHLYYPDKNKTFTAYANHAGFAVLPARSNRPKDKANVECHAGLIQRTFYQEVRNRSFYSVPHRYVGQKVRVIGTFSKIAIYDLKTLEKIASHSTSLSSQVDMMGWKTLFEDPVVADALVDRLTEPKRDRHPNRRLVPCQALKTRSQ